MRKSLKSILLCLCLCLITGLPAAAETSLSFGLGFGEAEAESYEDVFNESDLDAVFFGLDYFGDRLGVGLFYLQGSLDEDFDGNDSFYIRDIYGSWRLIDGSPFQLNLVLSYDWLKAGGVESRGFMAGFVGEVHFNDRWSLTGGFGYAIDPKLTIGDKAADDDSMWKASLKLNYDLNDSWAVNVGYLTYECSGDSFQSDFVERNDILMLGFTYRFSAAKPIEEAPPEPRVETPKDEPKPEQEPKVEEPAPEPAVEPIPITEEPKADETPEEKVERIERINEFLQPIFFHFDKYYLRKDQVPVLEKALEVINANKDLYILIAGHADPPGTNAYNQRLSERRALTVRNWLVKNGVDPKRITMIGYGEEYPYMAQSNDPKWESDRWADIVMTDQVPTKEMGIRK